MKLTRLRPCPKAAEWLLSQPDHQTAWVACTEPTWMIWYLGKTGCSRQMLVTIACRIARTVAHLAPPEALAAIEATERWVLDPSEENRRAADAAIDAAYAAADTAYAAADAARAAADAARAAACAAADASYVAAYAAADAAYAAYAAARAADAAYVAAYAADAARAAARAADAAYVAADAAYVAAKREHCRIIRELIPECPK